MPKRAAIYARVSTTDQADNGTSLATQQQYALAYARERGYQVAPEDLYQEDMSGFILERPLLDTLRAKARRGEVDVVICHALDRLSRNQIHQTVLFYELEQSGATIEFVTEKIDETPEGQFLRAALGFMAEKEREKFKERSARGKRERARRGGMLAAGMPVFGYVWAGERKERYVVDPIASLMVIHIFELSAAGKTSREIATILNSEGVLTRVAYLQTLGYAQKRRVASDWDSAQVVQVLKDATYKGQRSAYEFEKVTLRKRDPVSGAVKVSHSVRRRSADDANLIALPAATVPPIVTEALWDQAQATLQRHKTVRHSAGATAGIGLFRGGFAKCGYCGSHLIVGSGRIGTGNHGARALRRYYRCTSNRAHRGGSNHHKCPGGAYLLFVEKLDGEVWHDFSAFIERSEGLVDVYAEILQKGNQDEERDTSTLKGLLANLERERRKKANYAISIGNATNTDTITSLTQLMETCSLTIERIEAEIATFQVVVENHREYRQQVVRVVEYLRMARSTMDLASYEEKRTLLFALGVQVICYRSNDIQPNGMRYEVTLNFGGITQSIYADATVPATKRG